MRGWIFCWASLLRCGTRGTFCQAFLSARNSQSSRHSGTLGNIYTDILIDEGEKNDQHDVEQLSLKQERLLAKKTWETIALCEVPEKSNEVIHMRSSSKIYDKKAFERFFSVKGTYFVNGLGSCKVGNRLVHPFEAPGFLKSLAFHGDGSIIYKKAVIQTPLTTWERKLNMMLAKGVMSSVAPFDFGGAFLNAISPSERNTANVAVELWPPASGGDVDPVLIVGGDMGHPYIVDPDTLETIGPLDQVMDGVGDIKRVFAGRKLLAHTRVDKEKGTLIFCASTLQVPGEGRGGGNTKIEFFEFDVNFRLVSSREHVTDFIVFHDWMITKDYYVVPKNPATFDMEGASRYMAGLARGTDSFQMDESNPGSILLIPRDPKSKVVDAESDRFFNIFHLGPCYQEESDDTVVVHGAVFDHYKFGGEMGFETEAQKFDPIAWSSSGDAPAPRLDKYVISLAQEKVVRRTRFKLNDKGIDVPVDMPVFLASGKKMRYSYFSGAARTAGWFPFHSIVKVNLESGDTYNWDAGNESIVSEAVLIPTGGGEEDAFVCCIEHDGAGKSCSLVVWNAARFKMGPICTIELGTLMPWCVHGSWTSYVTEP